MSLMEWGMDGHQDFVNTLGQHFSFYVSSVQDYTTFKTIINQTNNEYEGLDFSSTPGFNIGYWPFVSYRTMPDGMMIYSTGNGYYWTANLNEEYHPYFFNVSYGTGSNDSFTYSVKDDVGWYQADAYGVRCVRE